MIKVYSEFGPVVLETKDKDEYEKLVKFLESKNIEMSLHTPGNMINPRIRIGCMQLDFMVMNWILILQIKQNCLT